jgi:hypothetical protein
MMARLRSPTRRRARAVQSLVASACLWTGAPLGCGQNNGLGKGAFSYVCPAPDPADPSAPSPDAVCDPDGASLANLPEVAVASPFSLRYSQSTSGAPRPAVASLAVSTSQGWSLMQPGWLGFIAWSGSDVADFTHVHAESIASARLDPAPTTPLSVGAMLRVTATPLDAAGTVLGGVVPCTFASSNPGVLSLAGAGRVAQVIAAATGETTLSAECLGARAQVTIQVAGPLPEGGK